MEVRSKRIYWLGIVAAVAMFFSWTARSHADVYCVPASSAGCSQSFAALQDALDAAAAHPSSDTVRIAAGTYTGDPSGPGGFSYSGTGAINNDSIFGSAMGNTKIRLGNTTGSQAALSVATGSAVAVSNIDLVIPPNVDGPDIGMDLSGDVEAQGISVTGTEASNSTGISCTGCWLNDDRVDLPADSGSSNIGIDVTGSAAIYRAQIQAGTGVLNSGTGTALIALSRVQGFRGVVTQGGGIGLLNSLVILDPASGATGIGVTDDQPTLDETSASISGVTIAGTDSDESSGIKVHTDQSEAEIVVGSTVIAGVEHALSLTADDGSSISVTPTYSAMDTASNQIEENSGGVVHFALGQGSLDLQDPQFVDSAAGDFTPAEGSPLVDAGDPTDPYRTPGSPQMPSPWQEQFDAFGHFRACQGSVGEAIRRDIGGIERMVTPYDDCTAPDTAITSGPEAYPPAMYTANTAEFDLHSTEPESAFECSIDGAAFSNCSTPYVSPELARGEHTFSFRARDQFGNVDPSPIERVVYLGANKGHLPTPHTLSLKYPKKTRAAKVKVRFKSSETGSSFKCRLNKGKWRKCKSPWKTPKLRKGKNTIAIQATDKAGNSPKVIKRTVKRVVKKKHKRR